MIKENWDYSEREREGGKKKRKRKTVGRRDATP
jgi:hypothetical protein